MINKGIFQKQMREISELRQSMQKMMQVVDDLQREVSDLKRSNSELRDIVRESHLVINKFPVNRTNWISQSPTVYHLTENDETFTVMASSTWCSNDDCAPHKLFTENEGEISHWASDDNQQNSHIILKYPNSVKCNFVRMKSRNGCLDQCPSKFEIRGSNQEIFAPGECKVLKTYENTCFANNEVKIYSFENEEKYQYYSIFIISISGGPHASLSELNFGYAF